MQLVSFKIPSFIQKETNPMITRIMKLYLALKRKLEIVRETYRQKNNIRSTASNALLDVYYKQNYNHSKIYLCKNDVEPIDSLV